MTMGIFETTSVFRLPPVPESGNVILPLLNPEEIFQAELAVIESAQPNEELFLSQYDLPELWDGPPAPFPASQAQRKILWRLADQIAGHQVKVFLIADNGDSPVPGKKPHNEITIDYLHKVGAFVLPYPKQYVLRNHTKFLASRNYIVITSANLSSHESDFLDDNTGFLIAGQAAEEGISYVFLPQWNFSVREDSTGWASRYPPPMEHRPEFVSSSNPEIVWLNTAPREEFCGNSDVTEIKEAYQELIRKAVLEPSGFLYLAQFDVSNLELVSLLLNVRGKNPNLDIRILMDPYQYLRGLSSPNKIGEKDPRVTAFRELKESGIPCRFPKRKSVPGKPELPQLFHDKFAVSSRGEVINGSANFSSHSLNGNEGMSRSLHNREADVRIRNPWVASVFLEKFRKDWENSTESPFYGIHELDSSRKMVTGNFRRREGGRAKRSEAEENFPRDLPEKAFLEGMLFQAQKL